MDERIRTLKRLPLFDSLTEIMLSELAKQLEVQQLEGGETLFHKGEKGDALYIVDHGQVKVVANNVGGEEVVLNQFGPGESFGEMSLVDEQPRSATAIAVTPIKLLRLQRDDFLGVVTKDPHFALEIIRDLSDKLRFAATYIQKAAEWSQLIINGDYSSAMGEIQTTQSAMEQSQSDEARAGAFLSAFFQMIETVKEREETLLREVQQLRIVIDETAPQAEVSEITSSEYFQDIRQQVQKIRSKEESDNS